MIPIPAVKKETESQSSNVAANSSLGPHSAYVPLEPTSPRPRAIAKLRMAAVAIALGAAAAAAYVQRSHVAAPAGTTAQTTAAASERALRQQLVESYDQYLSVAEGTESVAKPGADATTVAAPKPDDDLVPLSDLSKLGTWMNPQMARNVQVDRTAPPPAAAAAAQKLETSMRKMAEAQPNFMVMLSLCHIPGHDVHFITPGGVILYHVTTGAPLPPQLDRARQLLLLNRNAPIRTLVFKDKIQVVGPHGAVLSEEKLDETK